MRLGKDHLKSLSSQGELNYKNNYDLFLTLFIFDKNVAIIIKLTKSRITSYPLFLTNFNVKR